MPIDDRTLAAPPPTPPLPAHRTGELELGPGTRVGDYLLSGAIAAGGCGTVYAARHVVIGRSAAVKVLHHALATSPEMVERFIREARVVNLIRHPNIVDIHGFGQLEDGRPYFVMELLQGPNLRQILDRRGRLTARESLGFLEPICAALSAAHLAGVVHRDLKASNAVVTREGDRPEVKLLDFGIAKLLRPEEGDRTLTAVGQRLGSPYAMAPEQIRGTAIDARADIYALGVLLHQLVTGRYPFVADDPLELERMHLEVKSPRPSEFAPVSPAIDLLIARALEKDPDRRFPTVTAFIEALRRASGGPGVGEAVRRQAMAVYLEIHIGESASDDEALLADLGSVLEETETELRKRGYLLYLTTGSAVLGVKLLSADPALAKEEQGQALALARQLQLLGHEPERDRRLRLVVQVHKGLAHVRSSAEGPELTGGPVVQIDTWVTESESDLHVTAEAREGL